MVCLALFLRVWQPRRSDDRDAARLVVRRTCVEEAHEHPADVTSPAAVRQGLAALDHPQSVFVFLWGTPQVKAFLDGLLHRQAARSPA